MSIPRDVPVGHRTHLPRTGQVQQLTDALP